MIELKVQNRAAEIYMVPTTSALLIKELGVYLLNSRKPPEIEKKLKISNTRETLLWNKLKKSPESLNIKVFLEPSTALWNKVLLFNFSIGNMPICWMHSRWTTPQSLPLKNHWRRTHFLIEKFIIININIIFKSDSHTIILSSF